MKGRVNTGGGGFSFNHSTIAVMAPTGSTVTCTKDGIVKTAVEKNGVWIFQRIENGLWAIKATKGSQSVTQTLDIKQPDLYKVYLAYFNATIETTFPTDCTSVTCKKGATTLSVPSGSLSSGSYTFNIPEIGEWVLYATNGTKEKTLTVNVTEEKAYTVRLSFELILFDNGTYASETGGWQGIKSKKLEASSRRQDGGVNSIVPWYSNNGIDISSFSTLKFNVDFGVIGEGDPEREDKVELVVGLTTDANKATTSPSKMTAKKSVSGATGIYELDVSSINGVYHVTGITDGGAWTSVVKTSRTTTIKVWLE